MRYSVLLLLVLLSACISKDEVQENQILNEQEYQKIQEKIRNPDRTIEESLYQENESG